MSKESFIIKLIEQRNKENLRYNKIEEVIKEVIDRPLMDVNNVANLINQYIGQPCNIYKYKDSDYLPRGNKRWYTFFIAARSKEEAIVIHGIFDTLQFYFFNDFEQIEDNKIIKGNSDDFLNLFKTEMFDYKSWLLSETNSDALEFQSEMDYIFTSDFNLNLRLQKMEQVEVSTYHGSEPHIWICDIQTTISRIFYRGDKRDKHYCRIVNDPVINKTYYEFINYELLKFEQETYEMYSNIVDLFQ